MTLPRRMPTLLCALLVALLTWSTAAAQSSTDAASPPADPDDVASIDAIITAAYAAMSGPAGEKRDWDRFRSLFKPDMRFIHVRRPRDGGGVHHRVQDLETFIRETGSWFEENGLFDEDVHRVTERFGLMAHVFSTYETRPTADASEPSGRGISSFQLMHDGSRWWILNWYWMGEREDTPIPARYLPTSR